MARRQSTSAPDLLLVWKRCFERLSYAWMPADFRSKALARFLGKLIKETFPNALEWPARLMTYAQSKSFDVSAVDCVACFVPAGCHDFNSS